MPNSYYNHATYPSPNAPGSSAALRAELDLITGGFNLLPTLTGNGYKVAMVNAAGTALIASSALQALAITSSTIDSTAIGGTTPSTGAFTTVSASSGFTGNLTGNVTGNVTGNATNVTGTVAVANGGTGATTVASARTNLLPSFTGNAGKVLAVNAGATDIEYVSAAGTGTVTSVAFSGGTTGLTVSGSPITSSGTITLAGTLAIANGGTGAATLTANNVLLGNGTSALQVVAPGSSGNVLTSNGTTWTSAAPAAGGGGMTLLATITNPNQTANGYILPTGWEATYKFLKLVLEGTYVNTGGTGQVFMLFDNSTAPVYGYTNYRVDGGTALGTSSVGQTSIQLGNTIYNGNGVFGDLNIFYNPNSPSNYRVVMQGGVTVNPYLWVSGGTFQCTSPPTQINFPLVASGTYYLSGTAKIYGVK